MLIIFSPSLPYMKSARDGKCYNVDYVLGWEYGWIAIILMIPLRWCDFLFLLFGEHELLNISQIWEMILSDKKVGLCILSPSLPGLPWEQTDHPKFPAVWLAVSFISGRHQHKIRGQERRLSIFFLSQLCWDLDSGCVHMQLQLLLGSPFLVPEIPGNLQEHHPFSCSFRLSMVTASCCCKSLDASVSFAGSLHLVHTPANHPFTKVTSSQLSCFSHTLIDSVSEELRKHLRKAEQVVFGSIQIDLLMKYIANNENLQNEGTQVRMVNCSSVDYHRSDIEVW